jgi:hypothetical protein
VIFFYFFLPEMKGRSLEELDELFIENVSVRDFTKYATRIKEEAIQDVKGEMGRSVGSLEKNGHVEHAERVVKAGGDMA